MPVVAPPVEEVRRFLATHHAAPVEDLDPLGGGFWSSAWGYRIGDQRLVLRVSDDAEGFRIDRSAMRFAEHGLPVPEVHEVGEALGGAFAISQRCEGRFLERVEPHEVEQAGPALLGLLHGLRSVPSSPTDPVIWYEPRPPHTTWRDWLVAGLTDDPAHRVSGWRSTIAGDAHLDRLFRACEVRIGGLLEACPERRDLVHGDLLHGNVLVSPDASEVTAVFSWKCSVRGDFLYDLAWCTFWSPWHPGIAAVDLWSRWRDSDRDAAGAVDAAARHHCYELQIGASHLGWYVWTSDDANLRDAARHLGALLDRGPLAEPPCCASTGEPHRFGVEARSATLVAVPEPFLPFRTERLLVRAFAAADVPSFARYRNDPDVARYQDWPLPYTEEAAQRLVDSLGGIDGPVAGEWVQLALELDGELAGDLAVGLDEHGAVATIGYTLRPEHQGRGLAREAVAALIDRLFERCGIHRVQASVDPANTASIRLLEALRFAHEGLSRRAVLVRGEWADDDRWALLADEWASPPRSIR